MYRPARRGSPAELQRADQENRAAEGQGLYSTDFTGRRGSQTGEVWRPSVARRSAGVAHLTSGALLAKNRRNARSGI